VVKVAFQLIVFQDDYFLEPVLESVLPFGPVVATEGPITYWQNKGFLSSTDRTNEILAGVVGEKNVIHGQWHNKTEMCNAAVHLVPPDTTHVWHIDADEVWKPKDISFILSQLDDVDSVSFRMHSFYGGFEHVMTGYEENFEVHRIKRWYVGARWHDHRPPSVLAPDGRRWRDHRHVNHWTTDSWGVRFYHYSYVFPSQIKAKTEFYSQYAAGRTLPRYFDHIYRPWVLGDAQQRQAIEDTFDGVHDFLSTHRGPCRTKPFEGEHPAAIQKRLPQLKERFERERLLL